MRESGLEYVIKQKRNRYVEATHDVSQKHDTSNYRKVMIKMCMARTGMDNIPLTTEQHCLVPLEKNIY